MKMLAKTAQVVNSVNSQNADFGQLSGASMVELASKVVPINFQHISFLGTMVEYNGQYAIGGSPKGHVEAGVLAKKQLQMPEDLKTNGILTFNVINNGRQLIVEVETSKVETIVKNIFETSFSPHISSLKSGMPVAFKWP